ncbi:PALB protein [Xylariomycetidae sp. FL2044]|nr:PALB protein [Xylariomycetidae sp. FL2044]
METRAKEQEALISQSHGKAALEHTIAAAELYMKAASAASTALEKKRLKKKCEDLILSAESLKKSSRAKDSVSAVERRLQLPRPARQLLTCEKNLLYRNSRLHGFVFPPWESDPDPLEFSGHIYSDPAAFSLSDRQSAVFDGWKRPLELLKERAGLISSPSDDIFMRANEDYDLVQDITTDCSVVASLCASIGHLKPGPNSVLPMLMFPVDSETGQPSISPNGKYIFRMFFNGCFRKVVIDDRLPSSSTDRTLYVVDRQNPGLIWPALMEKAYLKVRGGYDFPGSNSATDLHALTGWIPQQLFLQSDDLDWNQTWKRIKKAYDYGDVIVTLGTGRLSMNEEETLGLAGEHDYAVLDMSESSEDRRFLVKNPWCDGLVWKGLSPAASQAPDKQPVKLKPGTFWISFDDVTQNFESLYLNWNPSLFTERQDHHLTWQLPDSNVAGSFAYNPQYSMRADADGQTWILLSRHFQDAELEISKKRSATLADVSNMLGFMSIYIFTNEGHRVQLSDKSIYRGPYVDSPQTLAPFEAKKGVKYTIVIAAQSLPLPKYDFTLSFFSRTNLTIAPAAESLKHHIETQSSWTRRTSGGNSASPSYLQNPQFGITLPRAGPLSILLCTAVEDLAVHIDLVWAGGRRVTAVTVRDLVGTSGDYRRGCALAQIRSVDAGTYTLVCSTFEPGQLADFTLRIGSDTPCTVAPVPADAAGRLRTRLPNLVFRAGENQKRAPLSAARLMRASIVVTRSGGGGGGGGSSRGLGWSSSPSSSSSASASGASTPRSHPTVRVSLECGRGPNREVLAATGGGEFKEAGLGLRTPEFDIEPRALQARGGLWLVVEQMGAGLLLPAGSTSDEGLAVEVLSEGHVQVGGWETVDG